MRTAQAPTSVEGGSVPVTVGFRVTDTVGVDDVNQRIEVDLVMRVAWTGSSTGRFARLPGRCHRDLGAADPIGQFLEHACGIPK